MLIHLLDGKIQFIETANDWKEAIRISAKPLLDNDSIEERYIEAMIAMCEKYDAYIVLADRFAMPHASPESGVKKMDVAITISRQPIDFLGRPVQLLFTLASADKNSHIYALQELSDLLEDESKIGELIGAKTKEEVTEIINQNILQKQ